MDVLMDGLVQFVLALLGGVLTYFATKIGAFFGKMLKSREEDKILQEVAKTCVYAVEQMYREHGGEEKLLKALEMGEKLLEEKGIRVKMETLRCLLEAALSEAKGAFLKA